MRSVMGKDGYARISLCNGTSRKCMYVHRLVAESFLPNSNNLPEVNHLDGNKANNSVHNLVWCSKSENIRHAYDSGLIQAPHTGKFGAAHHCSKKVRGVHRLTQHVVEFGAASEAARHINKNKSSVINAIAGRRKTSGGYAWSYID